MTNIAPIPHSRPTLAPLGPPGFQAFQEARSRYLRRFTPPREEPPSPHRTATAHVTAPSGARPG